MDSIDEHVRKILNDALDASGMTQIELAKKAKLDHGGVNKILKGRKVASRATIAKLSAALGLKPSDLLPNRSLAALGLGALKPEEPSPRKLSAEEYKEIVVEALREGGEALFNENKQLIATIKELRDELAALKTQLAKANAVYSAYEKLSPDLKLAADALLSTSQEELDEIHAQSLRSLSEPSLKKS